MQEESRDKSLLSNRKTATPSQSIPTRKHSSSGYASEDNHRS